MGRSFVLQRPGRDLHIMTDHLAIFKSSLSTFFFFFLILPIGNQLDIRNANVDTFLRNIITFLTFEIRGVHDFLGSTFFHAKGCFNFYLLKSFSGFHLVFIFRSFYLFIKYFIVNLPRNCISYNHFSLNLLIFLVFKKNLQMILLRKEFGIWFIFFLRKFRLIGLFL